MILLYVDEPGELTQQALAFARGLGQVDPIALDDLAGDRITGSAVLRVRPETPAGQGGTLDSGTFTA